METMSQVAISISTARKVNINTYMEAKTTDMSQSMVVAACDVPK